MSPQIDDDNDIIKNAAEIVETSTSDAAQDQMARLIAVYYKALVKHGFTVQQAFDLASDYQASLMFPSGQDRD